jgi:hypothetical protein
MDSNNNAGPVTTTGSRKESVLMNLLPTDECGYCMAVWPRVAFHSSKEELRQATAEIFYENPSSHQWWRLESGRMTARIWNFTLNYSTWRCTDDARTGSRAKQERMLP